MPKSFNALLPLTWVRAERYCELTGEPLNTIRDRANSGIWAAGHHFKRIGQRTLVLNLNAITDWFNKQPHVESVTPNHTAHKTSR